MTTDEKYRLSTYKEISLLVDNTAKKVYIVKDDVTDRLFIKRVLPCVDNNIDFYQRLASLEHKNLARIYDVFQDGSNIYVVEEYISGQTLQTLLENEGIQTESKAVGFAGQVCDALAYLHSQSPPIIHRDIKPENIMLSNDGVIKLVDFDIAREHKKDANRDTVFMGTKEYAAPEQYGYKQTDCRTDIYAVGVLLHELITGRLPQNNINYSGSLKPVITRCLRLDPERRYQNVSALKRALLLTKFTRHRKTAALAVLILALTAAVSLCFPMLLHHIDNINAPPPDPVMQEIAELDLYDLLVRIAALEESPTVLLQYEAIDKVIRDITGDLYYDVTNAFQEFYQYSNMRYEDPKADLFVVPTFNRGSDGFSVHDKILLELGIAEGYISITYFDRDLDSIFYFTTLEDKGVLTKTALDWIMESGMQKNRPIIFHQASPTDYDITGVYYVDGRKKVEIFEDSGEMKFSYTDISKSLGAEPLVTKTIDKIDNFHYWVNNMRYDDKHRLIFNFSEKHLLLLESIYDEKALSIEGIYTKE